jgi:uncharacterized protein YbjT (DUF2867 family)
VVGTDRLLASGYFRGKAAQEKLIEESPVPFTIVRSTQFFEFVRRMADEATDGNTVRFAPVYFQPIAGDDVARAVGRVAVGPPVKGTVEIAGPERVRMDEFFRDVLAAGDDPRTVVADPDTTYFGADLAEQTLTAADDATLGETRYSDWKR